MSRAIEASKKGDVVEYPPSHNSMVDVEPPGQRLGELILFGPHPALGQLGQPLRITLPAINASTIA